jgi:hypothetical protein
MATTALATPSGARIALSGGSFRVSPARATGAARRSSAGASALPWTARSDAPAVRRGFRGRVAGRTIAPRAAEDDEPVVGKSSFDFDAEMIKDMERLKADSPLAKEAAAAEAAGTAVKTESQLRMEAIKEGIDTFLLYDFFVILAILTWLIVGVGVRLSHGGGLSYDEPFLGLWLFLWPFLFQPLLGVHMLATIVSPVIGKLKDRGLVSKDTWT